MVTNRLTLIRSPAIDTIAVVTEVDGIDTAARLTEVAHRRHTAAFRSHSGRWELLPAANLKRTAELVSTLLAPCSPS